MKLTNKVIILVAIFFLANCGGGGSSDGGNGNPPSEDNKQSFNVDLQSIGLTLPISGNVVELANETLPGNRIELQ